MIDARRAYEVDRRSRWPCKWSSADLLKGFGDNAVALKLHFRNRNPMNGMANVKSDVLLQIWDRFRAHGFEFPSPQREVRIATRVEVRVRGRGGGAATEPHA